MCRNNHHSKSNCTEFHIHWMTPDSIRTSLSRQQHVRYLTRITYPFSEDFHEEIPQAVLLQFVGSGAATHKSSVRGVYEADHYRGFMVYISMSDFSASHLVQQTFRSPFAVAQTLTTKLGGVWPAIPYFAPLIA